MKDNEFLTNLAREAAIEMQRNFTGQTFTKEYAAMSETIILSALTKATEADGWQELHDGVIELIPQQFRQNSYGAVDCVRKLVKAFDKISQENHEYCHGYRTAPASAEQQDFKVGDWVKTSPDSEYSYEVAGLKRFPHGVMVGIYDEPPSKHIDYWNASSLQRSPFQPQKERTGEK